MHHGCHLCRLLWESLLTDERIIDSLIQDDREDTRISIQAYDIYTETMERRLGLGEKIRIFSGTHRIVYDEIQGGGASVGLYGRLDLMAAEGA